MSNQLLIPNTQLFQCSPSQFYFTLFSASSIYHSISAAILTFYQVSFLCSLHGLCLSIAAQLHTLYSSRPCCWLAAASLSLSLFLFLYPDGRRRGGSAVDSSAAQRRADAERDSSSSSAAAGWQKVPKPAGRARHFHSLSQPCFHIRDIQGGFSSDQ